MADVQKSLVIEAPLEAVWAALTDPQAIRGWMGGDSTVEVDLREGGAYQVFGGETTGKFTRIDPPVALEYTWRQAGWAADWPDSVVRWRLDRSGAGTLVHLTHADFPNAQERDGHDEGWDLYWLEPMKDWLEGGE
jgi:uncharacterized protein YndB with AHSA1/START domain